MSAYTYFIATTKAKGLEMLLRDPDSGAWRGANEGEEPAMTQDLNVARVWLKEVLDQLYEEYRVDSVIPEAEVQDETVLFFPLAESMPGIVKSME